MSYIFVLFLSNFIFCVRSTFRRYIYFFLFFIDFCQWDWISSLFLLVCNFPSELCHRSFGVVWPGCIKTKQIYRGMKSKCTFTSWHSSHHVLFRIPWWNNRTHIHIYTVHLCAMNFVVRFVAQNPNPNWTKPSIKFRY